MEGQATISSDVLGRYAADAAGEIAGVRSLVASQLHRHRGVRVTHGDDGAGVSVELHLEIDWGSSIPDVGRTVQERVADYLERMAGLRPAVVNVVFDSIGPAR